MNVRPALLKWTEILSFLLAFLLPSISVCSQEKSYNYTLKGYLGIQGGESFNYQLYLNDSVDDYLSGIAYTYSSNNKKVTTRVQARRYPAQKKLHIQETTILSNEGFQSKAVICLINAMLEMDSLQGNLSGPIITQTVENGATCSKGSISLIYQTEIKAVLQKTGNNMSLVNKQGNIDGNSKTDKRSITVNEINDNKRTNRNSKPKVKNPQNTSVQSPTLPHSSSPTVKKLNNNSVNTTDKQQPVVKEITEGKTEEIIWNSATVKLQIWDDKIIDYDRISILINNQPVLENHTLTGEKKTLLLDLKGNELNIITILALNNGSMPPNTANILLTDGEKEYPVIAHNQPGKKAIIRIRRTGKKQD